MSRKGESSGAVKELTKLLSKLNITDIVDAAKLLKEDPKIASNLSKVVEQVNL